MLSIIGALILFGGTSAANIRIFIVFYVMGNVIGEIHIYTLLLMFSNVLLFLSSQHCVQQASC